MSNARDSLHIDGCFTPPEAARAAGLHVSTIYAALDRGKLVSRLVCPLISRQGWRSRIRGNCGPLVLYFIDAEELQRWLHSPERLEGLRNWSKGQRTVKAS